MQRYTKNMKKILLTILLLGCFWTSHTHCLIFRINKLTHFTSSEQPCTIFTCHDHHQLGDLENNQIQLQNFLDHLKLNPHKKRLIITESKWLYGIDCSNLTVEQIIQKIQPSFDEQLSYHTSPQANKFTSYISWQLPLTLCQERDNFNETSFYAVDPRLLIDNARFYIDQNKGLLYANFLDLLNQINKLLQDAVDCLFNDVLLNNIHNVFKNSLLASLSDYQKVRGQIIENSTAENISEFLNKLQDVFNKKYPGSLYFAEPLVSLEILKKILLQSHEFEEIFVFCGTRHALMLEFMFKKYKIKKICSYGQSYQEIENKEDAIPLIEDLTKIFAQISLPCSNSSPQKPVYHKKRCSRKQLSKSI